MSDDNSRAAISVTPAAKVYLLKMLSKEQGIGLRITIKKTGCSGYAYQPMIVRADNVNANDMVLSVHNEIKIYLDTKWQALLQGLIIDYIEEEKTGLRQKKLVFINPNETSRCGCGESFHVDGSSKHVS